MDLLARAVWTIARTNSYIEERLDIYQTIRSFLTRKHLTMNEKKHFEGSVVVYSEFGFHKRYYQNTLPFQQELKLEPRGGGFMHFDGVQSFIEEHTKVEALSFDKCLFRIYFGVLIVVLFVNFAHYLVEASGIRVQLRVFLIRVKRNLVSLIRKLCIFFNLKRHVASFLTTSLYGIKLSK